MTRFGVQIAASATCHMGARFRVARGHHDRDARLQQLSQRKRIGDHNESYDRVCVSAEGGMLAP